MLKGLEIPGVCLLMATLNAAAGDAADGPALSPGVCREPAVWDFKIVNDRWPDASSMRTFAEDAVRLSGAKTDQENALALWQWIRRCTMRLIDVPQEPDARGRGYVSDPIKILNVFGAHHCDGLSRVMQNGWRALGYRAQKYYRNGHTYADCYWVDADGVGRYHVFDMNYGWFCFTRDGSRLATGDEIGTDFSLFDHPSRAHVPWIDKKYWMWSWVHASHFPFSRHDVRLHLHAGDGLERLWDNLGRPYQSQAQEREWDDPDPRPYPWTYGNAVHRLTADLGGDWRGQLAAEPVNAALRDSRLVQEDPARPAEVVYRIRTPYIVADADLRATLTGGRVELSFSIDGARTWRPIAALDGAGEHTVTLTKAGLDRSAGPIGRYEHLLRVRLEGGAGLSALAVDTILQHNFLALPTLLPGENTIALSGRLAPGCAVEVTYVWDDPTGQGLTHTVRAEGLPFTYRVPAAGARWKDVRCRRLTVQVVPADSRGNRVVTAPPVPPASAVKPVVWTDVLTLPGPKPPPALKSTTDYLRDLEGTDAAVRRAALAGLIVRRDPQAWPALERIALEDVTTLKYYAVQALFRTDARRAWPVMKRLLEQDPAVKWPDVPMTTPKGGMWTSPEEPIYDNTASLVAALCAEGRITEATPLLCEALARMKYPEPRWGVLRSLGRLGDARALATVRRHARDRNEDTAATAVEAGGLLGDVELIPRLRQILAGRRGYSILKLRAIEALGRIQAPPARAVVHRSLEPSPPRGEGGVRGVPPPTKDAQPSPGPLPGGESDPAAAPPGDAPDATALLLPCLTEEDEDFRGAAAEALGLIGEPAASIPALEAALTRETFPWVRQTIEQALEQLRRQAK